MVQQNHLRLPKYVFYIILHHTFWHWNLPKTLKPPQKTPQKEESFCKRPLPSAKKCCTFFRWPKGTFSTLFKTFLSMSCAHCSKKHFLHCCVKSMMIDNLFIYLLYLLLWLIANANTRGHYYILSELFSNPPLCHVVHTNIKKYTLWSGADQTMKWETSWE